MISASKWAKNQVSRFKIHRDRTAAGKHTPQAKKCAKILGTLIGLQSSSSENEYRMRQYSGSNALVAWNLILSPKQAKLQLSGSQIDRDRTAVCIAPPHTNKCAKILGTRVDVQR